MESRESLYQPMNKVPKEEKRLLIEQKIRLFKKLQSINRNLLQKKNIDEFLNEENEENELENEFKKPKILINILGIILFTFHLISIYIINGIILTIEEELVASAKSYIKQIERGPKDDFYQNFNKINNRLPDYSVIFISSFLSECLNEFLGYVLLTIFVLVINFLVLFFGFNEYKFNIERNVYKNYNLNEFIYLYIIYLILCISQGTISLLPLKFVKEGFILYEKSKANISKNKRENDNNKKNHINSNIEVNIDNNKEKNKENNIKLYHEETDNSRERNIKIEEVNIDNTIDNMRREDPDLDDIFYIFLGDKKKMKYEIKGFFLFYLISIVLSIIIKISFDQIFIGEYKYISRKKVNIYFMISYFIFTIISLFSYLIFWYCILKEKKKKKKKTIKSSMKLMGYIIYTETTPNEDICCNSCYNFGECCEDCKICCDTLNLSLCCSVGSCKCCCKCIFCCDTNEENNKYKIRKFKDINKIESVCIFYRITGRWNWLGKIMTNIKIIILIFYFYIILITNIGFEDRIWNNIENNDYIYKNPIIINIITLGGILLYYIINLFGGKLLYNIALLKFGEIEKNEIYSIANTMFPGELKYNLFGLLPYSLAQTVISVVLSGIVYYRERKKYENYILSISIGSVEYIKIFILDILSFFFEINYESLELFSASTIFSIYLLIWNIILFILNLLDINNNSMLLFQFIFGLIPGAFLTFLFILVICIYSTLSRKKKEMIDK